MKWLGSPLRKFLRTQAKLLLDSRDTTGYHQLSWVVSYHLLTWTRTPEGGDSVTLIHLASKGWLFPRGLSLMDIVLRT